MGKELYDPVFGVVQSVGISKVNASTKESAPVQFGGNKTSRSVESSYSVQETPQKYTSEKQNKVDAVPETRNILKLDHVVFVEGIIFLLVYRHADSG